MKLKQIKLTNDDRKNSLKLEIFTAWNKIVEEEAKTNSTEEAKTITEVHT